MPHLREAFPSLQQEAVTQDVQVSSHLITNWYFLYSPKTLIDPCSLLSSQVELLFFYLTSDKTKQAKQASKPYSAFK